MEKKTLIILLSSGLVVADTSTWNGTFLDVWESQISWSPNRVPNGPDEVLVFSEGLPFSQSVEFLDNKTAGYLYFTSSCQGVGYTISSPYNKSLTLETTVGSSLIHIDNELGDGVHQITCPIHLAAPLVVDQEAEHPFIISGSIQESGAQTLTKVGSQTLILSGANNHTGGTVVQEGTLSISSQSSLGSGPLSLGNGTLLITGDIHTSSILSSSFNENNSTIDTQDHEVVFEGPIKGRGKLNKKGTGTLVLLGESTLPSTILQEGAIEGNTKSIQGDIETAKGTQLSIQEEGQSTYRGSLKGKGTLIKQAKGLLEMKGDQSSFEGETIVAEGELKINGDLSKSQLTVFEGAVLSGSGTFGPTTVEKGATLSPGNSIGVSTFDQSLILAPGSVTLLEINPTSSDQIVVQGTATLTGAHLELSPEPGFYGFRKIFKVLKADSLGDTTFGSISSTHPDFIPSLQHTDSEVFLTVEITDPFKEIRFANPNAKNLANNLEKLFNKTDSSLESQKRSVSQLNSGLSLPSQVLSSADIGISFDLLNIINSLSGQSVSFIESALNQMEPSTYSGISEAQTENNAKLITLFSRPAKTPCDSSDEWRGWTVPFVNSLILHNHKNQIGFNAIAGGLAFGSDKEINDSFVLGFGGAWDSTYLKFREGRGHCTMNTILAALYGDWQIDRFHVGGSLLPGVDLIDSSRAIQFVNRSAKSHYGTVDIVAQIRSSYSFLFTSFEIHPYLNFDFIYLHNGQITENDAGGLNLTIDPHSTSTFRSEFGLTYHSDIHFEKHDLCLSPNLSLGWVNMVPVNRSDYTSRFSGATIPFSTKGWDETWNLLSLDLGFSTVYKRIKFNLEYNLEVSPTSPLYLNQRGRTAIGWQW